MTASALDNPERELQRVRVALDIGRPNEALRLLAVLLAAEPENAALWTLLSEAHHDQDNYPEALRAADTAVRLDPQDHRALYFRALAHWNTHVLSRNVRNRRVRAKAHEAHDMLREAVRLHPFQPGYHTTLAKLLLQTDERDQAELHLRRALELAPDNSFALLGLAELSLERKNAPEAQRLAERVLAQEPDSVEGMGILAWAQLRQSDPRAALQTALNAVRLSPGDVAARAYFSALSHAYLPRPLAQGSWVWRVGVVPHLGLVALPVLTVGLALRNVWRYRGLPPELRAAVSQVRPLRREQGALLVILLSALLTGLAAVLATTLGDTAISAGLLALANLLLSGLVMYWLGRQVWKFIQAFRET